MAISVDPETLIITVPKADLTPLGGELYSLDVDDLRFWLKDWEDGEWGIHMIDTHRHFPEVTLGGVTLARVVEVINDYTITFENGQYGIALTGANNNVSDVTNVNSVSIRSNNSAGLTSQADPLDIAAAVLTGVPIEGTIHLQGAQRLALAALVGLVSGADTNTPAFRDTGDTKDRIDANVDDYGNRSSVTLDWSD